jgi:DNA-binding NarL/FixJ family response regulator
MTLCTIPHFICFSLVTWAISPKTCDHRSDRQPEYFGLMQIHVSIVEDDVKVRGSLARLIDSTDSFSCVSQHPDAENALREIPVIKPQIVLMDINLPGMDGVECVRRLKQLLPQTQVVMLTVYENTNIIFEALTAGASGYLLKRSSPDQIVEAIRDVHDGGSPMSSHIARKVVASFQKVTNPVHEYEKLSTREYQVLDYLAKGFLYREIAEELKISYATVHTHVRHIYEKLHVRSRTEAVTIHLSRRRAPL